MRSGMKGTTQLRTLPSHAKLTAAQGGVRQPNAPPPPAKRHGHEIEPLNYDWKTKIGKIPAVFAQTQSGHGQTQESGNVQFAGCGPVPWTRGAIFQKSWVAVKLNFMNHHVYKLSELIGTSTTTVEDAVNNALQRAGATVKNLRWFEVVEMRGDIDQNKVSRWQIKLKIGFTIEDPI
jgi:dodecin